MRGSGPGSVWEPGLEHAVKTEPLVTDTRGLSSRRLTIRKKNHPSHFSYQTALFIS